MPTTLDPAGVNGWYERAGVRTAPRRMDAEDEIEFEKDFFPVSLVPHLRHDTVTALSAEQRRYLNAQHLFQWLNFTTEFEVAIVNRAALRIARGESGVDLSQDSRMAALQIYVDEGYHSLYNLDVRLQLERSSGIPSLPYDFSTVQSSLDGVAAGVPGLRRLVQLLQVVVFETLITSILVDIPGDRSVKTLVRDTGRDHAVDEGRHHAYFSQLFAELWHQLSPATRREVGPYLPDLIVRSLAPNHEAARRALQTVGLHPHAVTDVIADSYTPVATREYIRSASNRTVALFERCGVLDSAQVKDRFEEFGLIRDGHS